MEKYIKSNIGLTGLMVLGVTERQYARCMSVINIVDAGKRLVSVQLDNTEFVDDGRGYDVEEGDGILTATVLYEYDALDKPLGIGEYRKLREAIFLHDPSMQWDEAKFIVEIACDVSWIPCGQGGSCVACRLGKWPHGCVRVRNCRALVRWEW